MALERQVVTDLISKYSDQLGDEAMAEIAEAILEADVPLDTTEIDALRTELQAEKDGRAADKAEYIDKINKFVYGGERPGDSDEPPVNTVDEVEDFNEYTDLNEMVYGKE